MKNKSKRVKASEPRVIGEVQKNNAELFPPFRCIKLYFTDRDFEFLDDFDTTMEALISEVPPALVELTYPAECHDAVFQRLNDPEFTGWPGAKVVTGTDTDGIVKLTMSHERARERRR